MAWLELHQSLPTHKKTKKLTRALGLKVPRDIPQVVGHLCMFWLWSIDNAPDGNLSGIDVADIADAAGWSKEPEAFMDAMREAGYIDGNVIHDWDDYIGRLLEKMAHQREMNRQKQQRYRDRKRNAQREDNGEQTVTGDTVTSYVPRYNAVTDDDETVDTENGMYGLNADWVRFVKCYEANIGLMPTGVSVDKLVSLYEDLGVDVMCFACEYVNLRQPSHPKRFIDKVLQNWIERGIKTVDAAKAYTVEFQRNIDQEKGARNGYAQGATEKTQKVIDGKFY